MTLLMGVVNVTPDSFSDGAQFESPESAIAQGLRLTDQGAAIVDVGGESTRPGALRISEPEELERVVPVVRGLAGAGVVVSVDTMRAAVAAAAVEAGAAIVNDVSGGRADPAMLELVASFDVDYVVMHWRSHSRTMQQDAHYEDVVTEVISELCARRDAAVAAGVQAARIILDPGIGFSKRGNHNWTLLAHLERFKQLGHRVLVGVSRKKFLGELLEDREPLGRDAATAAISTWCGLVGIWAVRTHEIPAQLDALRVAERLRQG